MILVTGATGFVGNVICEDLSVAGYSVRGAYHQRQPALSPGVQYVKIGGIGPTYDWNAALSGITHVVHLAAIAHRIGPQNAMTEQEYDQVNHLGTTRLAEAARSSGVVRFIFISSIGAVTSFSREMVDEETNCTPDTPYGRSKLAAERAVQRAFDNSATEWCILRPPLLYGKTSPGNMGRLFRLSRMPLPLPLASVANRRSFLYVGNLASAIRTALKHPGARNNTFCLADDEVVSTAELLRVLGRASRRTVRLFRFPLAGLRLAGRFGDRVQAWTGKSIGVDSATIEKLCESLPVSNARFRKRCEWRPPFTLEQGLAQAFHEAA